MNVPANRQQAVCHPYSRCITTSNTKFTAWRVSCYSEYFSATTNTDPSPQLTSTSILLPILSLVAGETSVPAHWIIGSLDHWMDHWMMDRMDRRMSTKQPILEKNQSDAKQTTVCQAPPLLFSRPRADRSSLLANQGTDCCTNCTTCTGALHTGMQPRGANFSPYSAAIEI